MFIPIPIGRTLKQTRKTACLLPCEACGGLESHVLCHVERRFELLFFLEMPLDTDRHVQCGRCGRERHVTPEEEEQIEHIASGFSALHRLHEVDPQAADEIAREIDRGWTRLEDLEERAGKALSEALTVEAAERRVKEGGHFPRL
jgi:hypothetical protein